MDAVDARELLSRTAPAVPRPVCDELIALLESMEPAGTLEARFATLERLMIWLAEQKPIELPPTASVTGKTRAARLWILVELLRESAAWRSALSRLVSSLLQETSAISLFSRTGLPKELRVFSEAADRLARKLLPQAPNDTDLGDIVARLFPREQRTAWLEEAPPALVGELWRLLIDDDAVARLRTEAADALSLLAVRVANVGLDDDVRTRVEATALGSRIGPRSASVRASPFLELSRVCDRILSAQQRRAADELSAARAECAETADACRNALRGVLVRLERSSVSVDLVFRLELLDKLLDRISRLLMVVDDVDHGPENVQFIKGLIADGIADRSLGALWTSNTRLLSKKIIESAGETGEHYITTTRAEYHRMVSSAAGGGLLTALTCVLKLEISWAKLPLFFEMLFTGLNYAGSFLLMQALGLTLATKQPSATAATLAGALDHEGRGGLDRLVDQIARTTRSQLAAVIGNVGMVIPAALGVHFLAKAWTGAPFLDAARAEYVIHSLHPLESGTAFYAAVTGVVLWASSIAAGWIDNWSVHRRLPEAIARHRLLMRVLGKRRAAALGERLRTSIAGIGGNVAIGFLLAIVPMLGAFFGLPLEVRHVTLSTGTLVLAGCSVGPYAVIGNAFLGAVAGIGVVALLNFFVSFALALSVALRARNVAAGDIRALAFAVIGRFFRRPKSFFLPPRDARTTDDVEHAGELAAPPAP